METQSFAHVTVDAMKHISNYKLSQIRKMLPYESVTGIYSKKCRFHKAPEMLFIDCMTIARAVVSILDRIGGLLVEIFGI